MLLKRLLFFVFCTLLCIGNAYTFTSNIENASYQEEIREIQEQKRDAHNNSNKNRYGGSLLTTGNLVSMAETIRLYDVCDTQGKEDCLKYHDNDQNLCQCITFFADQSNEADIVLQRMQYLSLIEDFVFYRETAAPMELKTRINVEKSDLNDMRAEVRKARKAVDEFCKADPYCRYGSNYYATQDAATTARQLDEAYTTILNNYNSRVSEYKKMKYDFNVAFACSAYAELDTDDQYHVLCCYAPNGTECEINFTFLFKDNGSPQQFGIDDSIAVLVGHIIREQAPLVYDGGVYTNAGKNICINVDGVLDKYEMGAKWNEEARQCTVMHNVISDVANPIEGGLKAFYDIHFGGDIDIHRMLGFFVSRQYPDLKRFECASRPAIYRDPSEILTARVDQEYVLRCVGITNNDNEIKFDFLFDDLSETFDYEYAVGQQVADCYSVGGLLNGSRCQVLSIADCDKLKQRGLSVSWNQKLQTCDLNAVSNANAINLAGEILGKTVVALATLPSGNGLVLALGWISTAGDAVEIGNVISNYYKKDEISEALSIMLRCYKCFSKDGCETKPQKTPGCPTWDPYCTSPETSNQCDEYSIKDALRVLFHSEEHTDSVQKGIISDVIGILLCDKDTRKFMVEVSKDKTKDYSDWSFAIAKAFVNSTKLISGFKKVGLYTALKTANVRAVDLNKLQKALLKSIQPSWSKIKKDHTKTKNLVKLLSGGDVTESTLTNFVNSIEKLLENENEKEEVDKACPYKLQYLKKSQLDAKVD